MEQLELIFNKYKGILINAVLLCALVVAILCKTDSIRSFSLGVAAGIVLIGLGDSINRMRVHGTK